jgi:citrate synthase
MLTVKPGLADVVAFDTEIAEPDRSGGSLRYRGINIEKLIGRVSFGDVWGLLVDGTFDDGLPAAEPFPLPLHTGDIRVDVQAAIAMMTPYWGLRPLIDIDLAQARQDLARTSVMMLSFVAQAARGARLPAVPQRRVADGRTSTERFMIRWHGDPDSARPSTA